MPTTGELAKQNIKDRYFGVNDPVAKKMMGRVHDMPQLKPPEDPTITTLFVGTSLLPVQDEIYGAEALIFFKSFWALVIEACLLYACALHCTRVKPTL